MITLGHMNFKNVKNLLSKWQQVFHLLARMLDKIYGLGLRNQIKWDRTKNLWYLLLCNFSPLVLKISTLGNAGDFPGIT